MLKRFEIAIPAFMSSTGVRVLAFLVGSLALAAIPFISSDTYLPYLVALAMTYALPALGLNIIMGYGPDISLGQHGLFAVGAYGTAISMAQLGLPFGFALLLGTVAAGLLSALIALPALRLHGLYLAIGTLAFGLVVNAVAQSGGELTGGRMGLGVEPVFTDERYGYLVTLAVFLTALLAYRAFVLSKNGNLLLALKDHKIGAQAMGVGVVRVKLISFTACGLLAGAGGGLYAVLVSYIASDSFGLHMSLLFLLMVVVGGSGTVYGPVLGAVFVVTLPEFTDDLGDFNEIIFGVAIVLVMYFMRDGIAGLFRRALRRGMVNL